MIQQRNKKLRNNRNLLLTLHKYGIILTILIMSSVGIYSVYSIQHNRRMLTLSLNQYNISHPVISIPTPIPTISPVKESAVLEINQFNFSALPPLMEPNELWLFSQQINTCSKSGKCQYLEWGSGGSTQYVSVLLDNQANIHANSIEHAVEWCQLMMNDVAVKTAIAINKLSYHCVDTGVELAGYGRPFKTIESKHTKYSVDDLQKMQIYIDYIDKINATYSHYDLVLIDGRFRTGCGLKLILGNYIDTNSIVLVHDYIAEYSLARPYFWLEKYYDRINQVGKLVVLKRKSYINYDTLKHDLDYYWRWNPER